jgi:uncharacterized membrane protein YcaP (DUF421 family)
MLNLSEILLGPLSNVLRTLILGVLAYVSLVFILRLSGKRTLSKLNAFDLVVTVALGSCLATVLLSKDSSWLQGVTAFCVLIGMQLVVAWLSARSPSISALVKSSPALVYYRGQLITEALRRERLSPDEVYAAIRGSGAGTLESIGAVVLESDGSLSVVRGSADDMTVLQPGAFERLDAR